MNTYAQIARDAASAVYATRRYPDSKRSYAAARAAAKRAVLAAYPALDVPWPDAYRSGPVPTGYRSRSRYARRVAKAAATRPGRVGP
jgi:hypothetical protein